MVDEFVIGSRPLGGRAWMVPLVPGVLLFLFGLLVLLVPEILVALVAGLFMVAGLALVSLALRLRSGRFGGWRPPPGMWPR